MTKQFGGKLTPQLKEKYSHSKQWDGKKFLNLEDTTMDISPLKIPKLVYQQFFKKQGRIPKQNLPIIPLNEKAFLNPSKKVKFIWYGHSVVLLRIANKTILIDPMLGENAAPISPFGMKRFSKNTLDLITHFPEIDLILLSHDHYDHLDLDSIILLKTKVKQFYVALGCGRHLEKWGIPETIIKEFDWWNTANFEGIDITFTPTRHFSGRGLTDRAKSLWGGWAIKNVVENIYFSGDSGYGNHFKTVGEKLGPFDFAFMECGQYNDNWRQIHMFPEESVQAAKDVNAQLIMPVHWAGFALAQHHWKDPIERFSKACKTLDQAFTTPPLGALIDLSESAHATANWENMD